MFAEDKDIVKLTPLDTMSPPLLDDSIEEFRRDWCARTPGQQQQQQQQRGGWVWSSAAAVSGGDIGGGALTDRLLRRGHVIEEFVEVVFERYELKVKENTQFAAAMAEV